MFPALKFKYNQIFLRYLYVFTCIFSGCLLMIVVLSTFGDKESDLGWSFYLLLAVYLFRIPGYIVMCFGLYK